MKKQVKKKFLSILLTIVTVFSCTATIPAMAANTVEVDTGIVEHSITIDGVVYEVVIVNNDDGSQTITVTSEVSEGISWTVGKDSGEKEEELVPFAEYRRTRSYGDAEHGTYWYIYNSTAANVWNLYRPLQDDGSAWAKGVSRESGYCESFADAVDSMISAEDRVSNYMLENEFTPTFEENILMFAAGEKLDEFLVAAVHLPSKLAGVIAWVVTTFAIPYLYENAIEELIDTEFRNIREAMIDANYYFELA